MTMKNKPLICKAPWSHFHVKEKGDMMLCCAFKGQSADFPSFEDYWNSEYLRNYRIKFLQGEIPESDCIKCIKTKFSRAKIIEDRTTYTDEQIRNNTSSDGHTSLLPHSIDIRIDLCNLQCVTCHYYSSSRWATHDKMERKLVGVFGKPVPDSILEVVQDLEWAGGEPFMSSVHFDTLSRLIEMGRASEVSLAYTTNGTFPGKTFNRSMDLIKQFKKVIFNVSIDGLGDIGEFIRDGWSKTDIEIFEQIREVIDQSKLSLLMGITLTDLGLFHLTETVQYAKTHRIIPVIHQVSTFPDNSFLDLNLVNQSDLSDTFSKVKLIAPELSESLDIIARNHYPRNWNEVDQASWLRRGKNAPHPEVFEQIITRLNGVSK